MPVGFVQEKRNVLVRKKGFLKNFRVKASFFPLSRSVFRFPHWWDMFRFAILFRSHLTNNLHVFVPILQLVQGPHWESEQENSLFNSAQAFVWEELPQRCRLLCRYTGLIRWTRVSPLRWSPSPPTWTEIHIQVLTAGFVNNTHGLSSLNMCTDLISSTMPKAP